MAKNITIPIPNHEDNCTQKYLVEYKLDSDIAYNQFFWFDGRVQINNVADASIYNVRITRYCCNGGISNTLTLNVDTTTSSPILDTPTGLVLTPGDEQIAANWDDVTSATEYVAQIAKDADFTVSLFEEVVSVSNYTFLGLTSGELHYVRVKARAAAYSDSPFSSTVTATPS